MCLTDGIFLQTHVTLCEYLVFHEFRRNLYITLAKYLEQDSRLFYYLIREIKTWLIINHITVHNNTYFMF